MGTAVFPGVWGGRGADPTPASSVEVLERVEL